MIRTFALFCLGILLTAAPATAQVPASGQPRAGGTLRMAESLGPVTLNPYFTVDAGAKMASNLNFEGLAQVAADGSYVPVLATEIPTQANGDVSADGTVVTWKLQSGVTWSDGERFTSQDVVFTYQMIMDTANPVVNRSDYAVMSSVAAPDDDTVVVTYKSLYAAYRLAFPSVLPGARVQRSDQHRPGAVQPGPHGWHRAVCLQVLGVWGLDHVRP